MAVVCAIMMFQHKPMKEIIAKSKKNFTDPVMIEHKGKYTVWEKGSFMTSMHPGMHQAHEFICRGWDFCEITKEYAEHNTPGMLPSLMDLASMLKRKPFLVRMVNGASMTPAMLTCCIYNYLFYNQQKQLQQQSIQFEPSFLWYSHYMFYLTQVMQLLQEAEMLLNDLEN